MMRVILQTALAIILSSSCVSWVSAQTHNASWKQQWAQANAHYLAEDFEQAVRGYEAILKEVQSGPIYYNLGNAWLKQGETGRALWAYKKAQHFIPSDPDFKANIKYAESLLYRAQKDSVQQPMMLRWAYRVWSGSTASFAYGILVGLLMLLFFWSLALWLPQIAGLKRVAIMMTLLGVFLIAALGGRMAWESQPFAIVVVSEAQARFAPSEDGTAHFSLPEGAQVKLLSRAQGGWLQVVRQDGLVGWVLEQDLWSL